MSGERGRFTLSEVIDILDQNYAIPGNGEDSDIASDFSESDHELGEVPTDGETTAAALEDEEFEILEDLHAVDVVESDDEDTRMTHPGRLPSYDFSETKWSEGQSEEQFQRGEFRQEICPVSVLPCEASALDFFHLLFTLNIVDVIVRETNKYALQCLASSGKNPSSFDKVTEIEMLAYLGLIIAMSLHPLHCIRDYWSTDWVLGVPTLARIFTVARFETITRYLHLNDNSKMPARGSPDFDKLYKVRPFLESIRSNFITQYMPHKQASVDEAMIKFKGRSSIKQYMPKKPIKRGIKMWCRADSVSGYMCDFNICTGKTDKGVQHDLGFSVVTKLCSIIYGKWHEVFFDNFFTSLPLIQTLFTNKTISCGTLRSGRKEFPKEMYDKKSNNKLERGASIFRNKGPITAVTWMDNKVVNLVSTLDIPSGSATRPIKRRKKDGEQAEVQCPHIITAYNKYMGGVDRNDQMASYYAIKCKSKKWWHRIFFELLNRSIVNSHILELESANHENRCLKDFRLELAKKLIGDFTAKKRLGRPSIDMPARLTERHFPSLLPSNEKGRIKERRCFVCSTKEKAKKTSYFCEDCGVGLCVAPCFRIHHTRR